jgi:1,4-dihydroxy-2-naphthoyl-CoA hydrolase
MRSEDDDQRLQALAKVQPPFAELLGMRINHLSPDLVRGELPVEPQLANRNGVLDGGALMGFADNLGGPASVLNLPDGSATATTIESKTNFFRPIPVGSTASALCVPLHRGRTTSVWQISVTTEDGKLAAVSTMTQFVVRS